MFTVATASGDMYLRGKTVTTGPQDIWPRFYVRIVTFETIFFRDPTCKFVNTETPATAI